MSRYLIVTDAGPFASFYAESYAAAVAYAIDSMGDTGWCLGTYQKDV